MAKETVIQQIDKEYALKDCRFKTIKLGIIGNVSTDYTRVFTIALYVDNNFTNTITICTNATFNCQTHVLGGIQCITSFVRGLYPMKNWRYGANIVMNMLLTLLAKAHTETKIQFVIEYNYGYNNDIEKMFEIISAGGDYISTNESDMRVCVIKLPLEYITDSDVKFYFEQSHEPEYDEDFDDSVYDDDDE